MTIRAVSPVNVAAMFVCCWDVCYICTYVTIGRVWAGAPYLTVLESREHGHSWTPLQVGREICKHWTYRQQQLVYVSLCVFISHLTARAPPPVHVCVRPEGACHRFLIASCSGSVCEDDVMLVMHNLLQFVGIIEYKCLLLLLLFLRSSLFFCRSSYLLSLCRGDNKIEAVMAEYKRLVPRVSNAPPSVDNIIYLFCFLLF